MGRKRKRGEKKEEKERTWANDKAERRQAITAKLLGASQLRQWLPRKIGEL